MNSRSVIHVIDPRTAFKSMLFRYSLSEPFIGVSGLIINYFDDRNKMYIYNKELRENITKICNILFIQLSMFSQHKQQHDNMKIWQWNMSYLYIFERRGKNATHF